MRRILSPQFFNRPAPAVARAMLGKFLVRRRHGKAFAYMITETEAYDGLNDRASHAARGKTERNAPMFGPPGHWYVYFTYGMHWMLNVVTGGKGYPAAVLIRGIRGIEGPAPLEKSRPDVVGARRGAQYFLTGPARLTKALGIDKKLNAKQATRTTGLWIEDRGYRLIEANIYSPKFSAGKLWRVKKSPRVGVSYAGAYWSKRHWRFTLQADPYILKLQRSARDKGGRRSGWLRRPRIG